MPIVCPHCNTYFPIVPGPVKSNPKKNVMKVVEVFGDFWHSKMFTGCVPFEHEQELVDAYKDAGYACLVVWESELKLDEAAVRSRVVEFITCST